MAIFLLVCKEDEKWQADFPGEEAFSSVLEITVSFIDGAIITEI